MSELKNNLSEINTNKTVEKRQIVKQINEYINQADYHMVELDDSRPWGAFFKLDNGDADRFVTEFFPEISLHEARLGNDQLELSPKILLVSPDQELSWQYHNRRAELWAFLNEGAVKRSLNDEQGETEIINGGEVIKLATTERHRLIGRDTYTIVAEIWQHTDPNMPSNEDDIIRLQDNYGR
jgi:mannose-6-phosphate isomerase-like protein (cupin superfamily)